MSTNLGTILVGLGYDLSALEKGAPEAFRLINSQTLGMSAEMKRASREGAESFRLIDESLGIHLSRPLTRLLTQEFPSLAKGLQSILGVGVVGALGVAGVELFDKIAKGIEKAQKAQEEFQRATQKTKDVFADAMAGFTKDETLRSLSGVSKKLFEIDYSSVEEARHKIEQLAEALQKEAKAAADANSTWTQLLAAIGEGAHVMFSLQSTLGAEEIAKQLEQFLQRYKDLSRIDALNQTHYSAAAIATELDKARAQLSTMQSMRLSGLDQTINELGKLSGNPLIIKIGSSQKEIDAQQAYIAGLEKINQLQAGSDVDKGMKEADARAAAALEAQHEAIRELQGDLKAWNDAANEAWKTSMKISIEIEKAAGVDFNKKISTGIGTLASDRPFASLGSQISPPPGAPQLADQVELQKVTNDQNESWKKAGEVLAQIETPFQKYTTGLAVLKELEVQGRLTTDQFAAAQQQLKEQLAKSTDQLAKLLEKTDSARAGMQAFFMQLESGAGKNGTGTFTFDILNKGLQGFEDETVKALTGAKTNWRGFFESLDQMALKFVLNKEFANLFKMLTDSSFGKNLGLDKLFGGAVTSAAQTANTTALTANTTVQAAVIPVETTLATASVALTAAVTANTAALLGNSVSHAFAEGTDFAPGGLSLVGENGPELVNLPTGASVTPNSALRGGGNVVIHIDAKGAEIGVEEKIARAISASAPQMIMRAVVEAAEAQRRSPH